MNIEFDDKEVNVKDIMRQIKENIAKRNIKDDILMMPNNNNEMSLGFSELENNQYILNRSWHYSADYRITSHRKLIGPLIVFGKKLLRKFLRWYINPIVDNQVEFNANMVRTINNITELLKAIEKRFYELENDIQQKNEKVNQQQYIIDGSDAITKIEDSIKNLTEVLEQRQKDQYEKVLRLENELDNIQQRNDAIQAEIGSLNRIIRIATERTRRIERNIRKNIQVYAENSEPAFYKDEKNYEPLMDFDYYLFEELYRGPRETIKEKQKEYLKYFNNATHVLDLGCGRGEFTELLLENGIKVTAVDINDDMVDYCQERGFPVVKSDILTYLESVEDNSVDGIFLGQVIEHLRPNEIISLVNLAFQKLKPTGWFIAETPNPQSLSVFAQSFYMDLTHVKPIHPYTAKFLAESAGFSEVQIHYISPNDKHLLLPELKIEGLHSKSLEEFNETIKHWNNVIFGYQDYYVAARK